MVVWGGRRPGRTAGRTNGRQCSARNSSTTRPRTPALRLRTATTLPSPIAAAMRAGRLARRKRATAGNAHLSGRVVISKEFHTFCCVTTQAILDPRPHPPQLSKQCRAGEFDAHFDVPMQQGKVGHPVFLGGPACRVTELLQCGIVTRSEQFGSEA